MISLRGPFLWIWGLNLLYLYALSTWGWLVDRTMVVPLMSVWLTWFVAAEVLGAFRNKILPPPEVARTFSQVMQFFASKDKGSGFWGTLTGWDAMVTGTALLVAFNAGWVVAASTARPAGWIVGVTVFAWNYGHWQNRRRHG